MKSFKDLKKKKFSSRKNKKNKNLKLSKKNKKQQSKKKGIKKGGSDSTRTVFKAAAALTLGAAAALVIRNKFSKKPSGSCQESVLSDYSAEDFSLPDFVTNSEFDTYRISLGDSNVTVTNQPESIPSGVSTQEEELNPLSNTCSNEIYTPNESLIQGKHEYLLFKSVRETPGVFTMGLGQAYYIGFFNEPDTMERYKEHGEKLVPEGQTKLEEADNSAKKDLLSGVCINFDDNQAKRLAYGINNKNEGKCDNKLFVPCGLNPSNTGELGNIMIEINGSSDQPSQIQKDAQKDILVLLTTSFPKIPHYHKGKFNLWSYYIPVQYSWFSSINNNIEAIQRLDQLTKYSPDSPADWGNLLTTVSNIHQIRLQHLTLEQLRQKIKNFVESNIKLFQSSNDLKGIAIKFRESFSFNCVMFNKMFSYFPIFLHKILLALKEDLKEKKKVHIYHPGLNLNISNSEIEVNETTYLLEYIFSSSCVKKEGTKFFTFEVDGINFPYLKGDLSSIVPSKDSLIEREYFFNNLDTFSLTNCPHITGDFLPLLGSQNLTSLNLSGCTGITGSLFLRNNSGLTSLDLSGCTRITGSLSELPLLENLTSLNLSGCTGITGSLSHLVALRNLTSLNLSGCTGITGSLSEFNKLTEVINPNVENSGITD